MIRPAFQKARNGLRSPCIRHLKQLGLALKQYSHDYSDRYPWEAGLSQPQWTFLGKLCPTYIEDRVIFTCPVSKDRKLKRLGWKESKPFASFRQSDVISYAYGKDSRNPGRPIAWTENARSTIRLLADKKAGIGLTKRSNHKLDGRNVLYHDGHVRWKPGPRALDPDEALSSDEDDDAIGAPGAADYCAWWSDPPYYGE